MRPFTACKNLVVNAVHALNGDLVQHTEFQPVKEKVDNIDKTIHHGDGKHCGLFEMVIRIDERTKRNDIWDRKTDRRKKNRLEE